VAWALSVQLRYRNLLPLARVEVGSTYMMDALVLPYAATVADSKSTDPALAKVDPTVSFNVVAASVSDVTDSVPRNQ
jgi:hypothetical protein